VFRAPEAQYADAFHIQFKPRRKRLIRQIIDDYKPSTTIVAGWDHRSCVLASVDLANMTHARPTKESAWRQQ
jgi:hypothetical protein